jgi:DDE superfamily endonuclease
MTNRNAQLLDLYSDYLIASFGQTTATGLANLVTGLSHDQVTRFLGAQELVDQDLWRIVKPHVRRIQADDAVLLIDDTVEEKPYSDQSELINWHFDHTFNRSVKGINLVSALYFSQNVALPVALHFIQKTELFTDPKTGKDRWKSPITKNEIAQSMVASALKKQIVFRYVLADTWFSSADNMVYIKNKAKRDFIIPVKANRNVFLGEPGEKSGKPVKLISLDFDTNALQTLWLEEVPFPLVVSRQVFKNENGSEGVLYLCSSDLTLSASSLSTLYQKRWKVEEYHKSLKSNASFSKSPTHTIRSQSNHFFASVVAYIKLEVCRTATRLNHFAQKAQLYQAALQSAFGKLQEMKARLPIATITT